MISIFKLVNLYIKKNVNKLFGFKKSVKICTLNFIYFLFLYYKKIELMSKFFENLTGIG